MVVSILLFVLMPVVALLGLLAVGRPRGYPAGESTGKLPIVPKGPAPGAKRD